MIGFPDAVPQVLQPLAEALDESERIALVRRITEALTRFGVGLSQNPLFVVHPALECITGLLTEHRPKQRTLGAKTLEADPGGKWVGRLAGGACAISGTDGKLFNTDGTARFDG